MKKLLYIFLLFSCFIQAQNYSFESIDKRLYINGWEIRKMTGNVVINDTVIVITTPYKMEVLTVVSKQQFIRHDDKIFSCLNESGTKVNLRLYCEDKLRKYFDLYYYGNEENNKYFRFCLTKLD